MRIVLAFLLSLFLSGAASAQEAPKLEVVVSFPIIADFVKQVGGEAVNVTSLVGHNGNTHDFEPTPKDAKALNRADIVFINGLGYESWIERLIQNSGYKLQVVRLSDGITPLTAKPEGDISHLKDGFYSGAKKDKKGQLIDPHAWQDPQIAKFYVENVDKFLSARDPAHASLYHSNAAAYIQKLDAFNANAKAELAKIPAENRSFLTGHNSFQYFGKAFGFNVQSVNGFSNNTQPSAQRVAELAQQVKEKKIKALFAEMMDNSGIVEQIASESGTAVSGSLYADTLDAPDKPAGSYIGMMEENVKVITNVLAAVPSTSAPTATAPAETAIPAPSEQ